MTLNLIQILAAIALVALITILLLASLKSNRNIQRAHPKRQKGFRRHWRKIYLLPIGIHRLIGWLPGQTAPSMQVEFANIGDGTYEDGKRSYIPDSGTAERYLLYKEGSDTDHCVVCGLNDTPLGSSDDLADANNLDVPITINLFGACKGTKRVVTDGTIVSGNYVKCGALGRATVAANGDVSFGRAVIPTDTTKAAGDVITIIPTLPAKYAF